MLLHLVMIYVNPLHIPLLFTGPLKGEAIRHSVLYIFLHEVFVMVWSGDRHNLFPTAEILYRTETIRSSVSTPCNGATGTLSHFCSPNGADSLGRVTSRWIGAGKIPPHSSLKEHEGTYYNPPHWLFGEFTRFPRVVDLYDVQCHHGRFPSLLARGIAIKRSQYYVT